MAKKPSSTGSRSSKASSRGKTTVSSKKPARAIAKRSASNDQGFDATDAFLKLLQSPLVADLLAVAATAALAALAEYGFNRDGGDKRRGGRAVKEAGKAAAAAIGRRLANEVDEIRSVARRAKENAGA